MKTETHQTTQKEVKHPDIARRINELLLENDTVMFKLAAAVGVSPQAVQQWCDGLTSPKGNNLKKAADFLLLKTPEQEFLK